MVKLFRNFLWTGTDCTTSHSLISWERTCKPVEEGGLVLRDLFLLNRVSVLRHLWNFISKKSTLWFSWCTAHLTRGKQFWTMKIPSSATWSWCCLLKGREDAARLLKYCIGKGTDTYIFNDPWLESLNLKDYCDEALLLDSRLNRNNTVDTLIQDGNWNLSPDFERLLPEATATIKSTAIHPNNEDKVFWVASRDGTFNLKCSYDELRHVSPFVNWSSLIWHRHAIPRQSFIAWMALHSALKTKTRTYAWGLSTDKTCVLCMQGDETETHLFLDCTYSRATWSILKAYSGFQHSRPQEEEPDWVIDKSQGASTQATILKILFTGFIYHTWLERNCRIFQNRSTTQESLAKQIRTEVAMKMNSIFTKLEDNPINREIAESVVLMPTLTTTC